MAVTLLTGPVASGKSALAVRIAQARPEPVVVIATAEALDDEMRRKIVRHRRDRPVGWPVIEEPRDLAGAFDRVPPDAVTIVDCLTLWVSNLLGDGLTPDAIEGRAEAAAATMASRDAPSLVVTNEVGWGIVPANDLARSYREVLGRVNRAFSRPAERVLLVVAGRAMELREIEP
jgi:adenosyl cobinamide kinase/adenosyl cobinamide phosphate guanylyltransferase